MPLWRHICDQQELILKSEEIFKGEKIFAHHDVKNKQLRKEENEKIRKENEQLRR